MKSLACSFAWWPGIDHDIEQLAKGYTGWQQVQHNPAQAPLHTWKWPAKPWQRIHIDYAGPFLGHMFLVVVDAHSKWPKVIATKATTSTKTIDILRTILARYGIPEQLVSDNVPNSSLMSLKCLQSRMVSDPSLQPNITHPWSCRALNVQTFKNGLKSMVGEEGSITQKLSRFLMAYRNAPHATTGQSPALMLNGRSLRSRLDILKPDIRHRVTQKQTDQT